MAKRRMVPSAEIRTRTRARKSYVRKAPRTLASVPPQGRLDVLASRLVERLVAQSGAPALQRLYDIGRPQVDRDLTRWFGPGALPPVARLAISALCGVPLIGPKGVGH